MNRHLSWSVTRSEPSFWEDQVGVDIPPELPSPAPNLHRWPSKIIDFGRRDDLAGDCGSSDRGRRSDVDVALRASHAPPEIPTDGGDAIFGCAEHPLRATVT